MSDLENDFVESFISHCLEKGITNMADICQEAIKERDEIDAELEKIHDLRERRENLQKVLRSLNHEEAKRGRRSKPPMVNPNIGEGDEDPTYSGLLESICDTINEATRSLTSREIINKVGYDGLDPSPVYMGMKWLLERGIIKRNDDRTMERGGEWERRPSKS
jgi:hypothetical protein